ncbi:CocE/NonD family hydrolase [Nocardia sp. NPDC051990]|uniref:CocE/NonD family hydrolase n=1 Tax=Nocardia sp. NPDC051990 TaxID=3155285 RepID=UPI003445EC46
MTIDAARTTPTRPDRWERTVDRLISRQFGLRPQTSEYQVSRNLRIPMRDGAELLADHYAPVGAAVGTVLVRSVYGWEGIVAAMYRAQFPTRGYHLVLVRCRGTFGSGGEFQPLVREIDDGADTVAWLRTQPWFDGRLATVGNSYLGFTQWALLMDPPPELAAAVIQTAPHDFSQALYFGGSFNLDWLGWSEKLAVQERLGTLRLALRAATARRRHERVLSSMPLADAADQLCEGRAPWFRDWVGTDDLTDPRWAPMRLTEALDRTQIPVLLQSGWQDIFLPQTRQQYTRLRERGVDVALTMGPWTHRETGGKGMKVLAQETLDWLDRHVAKIPAPARPAPVKMFVTGANEWREFDDWPEYPSDELLHPTPTGGLSEQPSTGEREFTYDPADPTPTIGGRLLDLTGGYRDDSALADRDDVLTFTSAPLPDALEIAGIPWVELAHRSDNPRADLFVRLSEVDPKGRSRNVSDGFLRLQTDRANDIIRIELDPIAHRFAAGNRIRLLIAGGSFPHWERNLGTGADPATSTRLVPAGHILELSTSRLHLPT